MYQYGDNSRTLTGENGCKEFETRHIFEMVVILSDRKGQFSITVFIEG